MEEFFVGIYFQIIVHKSLLLAIGVLQNCETHKKERLAPLFPEVCGDLHKNTNRDAQIGCSTCVLVCFVEGRNFGKSTSNNSNGKPLAMSKRVKVLFLVCYSWFGITVAIRQPN